MKDRLAHWLAAPLILLGGLAFAGPRDTIPSSLDGLIAVVEECDTVLSDGITGVPPAEAEYLAWFQKWQRAFKRLVMTYRDHEKFKKYLHRVFTDMPVAIWNRDRHGWTLAWDLVGEASRIVSQAPPEIGADIKALARLAEAKRQQATFRQSPHDYKPDPDDSMYYYRHGVGAILNNPDAGLIFIRDLVIACDDCKEGADVLVSLLEATHDENLMTAAAAALADHYAGFYSGYGERLRGIISGANPYAERSPAKIAVVANLIVALRSCENKF